MNIQRRKLTRVSAAPAPAPTSSSLISNYIITDTTSASTAAATAEGGEKSFSFGVGSSNKSRTPSFSSGPSPPTSITTIRANAMFRDSSFVCNPHMLSDLWFQTYFTPHYENSVQTIRNSHLGFWTPMHQRRRVYSNIISLLLLLHEYLQKQTTTTAPNTNNKFVECTVQITMELQNKLNRRQLEDWILHRETFDLNRFAAMKCFSYKMEVENGKNKHSLIFSSFSGGIVSGDGDG